MHTADVVRGQARGHRLDAFTLAGQKQAGAVGLKRNPAVGVARCPRQAVEVGSKPFLLCAWRPRDGVHNKNRISCFITQ